jgi:hypothetical protein
MIIKDRIEGIIAFGTRLEEYNPVENSHKSSFSTFLKLGRASTRKKGVYRQRAIKRPVGTDCTCRMAGSPVIGQGGLVIR